ncbi:MAG: bifunctional (p)ppGpp synthetase/guanosine-3',5'-bis(diphosphate) 3'-pyrophosphohydrolase [Muribaculaceae bacterium]|nr:bifunctional (p)ppGpp synthetase/guanosine-3',5'-bis(diphosphate) 3'-pyrophosphohydrolase [Muribaculaceae bacterium]
MRELTYREKREFYLLLKEFREKYGDNFTADEADRILHLMSEAKDAGLTPYDAHGLPRALVGLKTLMLFAEQINPDHNCLAAIALYPLLHDGILDIVSIRKDWGADVASLLVAMTSVGRFSHEGASAGYENLRGLMLSLADDIRVIIIMTVHNLAVMREINLHPDEEWVRNVAFEAQYIYSQLAHKLGLYKIKGELEDLSLKYTNREIYKSIAQKLNETKKQRDAYIAEFIGPVKRKLEEAGLKFEIKGRTKSISSIWGKMRKQKTDVSGIRDLFAIRVIIDIPGEKGKDACWAAYSIVGDMYQTDEKRMRDWLSFPKENGYESLHATVKGPQDKWVEVQIRTREMDEVAERGLAAHWRYKGGKGSSADRWMNNARLILENEENALSSLKSARNDAEGREVYAFTPKGQLFKLPPKATVLDFAFLIHTRIGAQCTGAIVNGQHRKINHRLESGDTVEILTSPIQTPRQSWLDIVVTSKARTKIRQSLNEATLKKAALGKEIFERRARNRKIDIEEALLNKFIRKEGYKQATEFFAAIEEGKVDVSRLLTAIGDYLESSAQETVKVSAGEYRMQPQEEQVETGSSPLVIDGKSISGIEYRLSKCCNPVFGDEIFGFFSADGALKIHKKNCPNVRHIAARYPERVVDVEWSGKSDAASYLASLRITGSDDLGIINNITSIISKDIGVDIRNLRVDSDDGIFLAILTVSVRDLSQLTGLIKKLQAVRGVKSVERV